MAITAVGSRGQFTTKTSSPTFAVSPNANMSAGALLLATVAWEAPGPVVPSLQLKDNQGNVYTLVAGAVGNAGTTATWVWACQLQHALATTDTLTFTLVGGARAPKAVELFEFSLGAGKVWANSVRVTGGGSNTATAVATRTIANMDSDAYLLVYSLSTQGPSTDAWTWQAGYTENHLGTTGGLDATNQTLSWGYRLATLTTDSVAVTDNTANRPWRNVLCALCEVDDPGAFPQTPVLDNFNRADVDPLDGVNWDTTCIAGQNPTQLLRIVSNQVAIETGSTNLVGEWYLTQNATNEAEVYVSCPALNVVDTLVRAAVFLAGTGCRGNSNIDGYEVQWQKALSGQMPGDFIITGIRATLGDIGPAFHYAPVTRVDGSQLGLRKKGKALHTFISTGAGAFLINSLRCDAQAGGHDLQSGKIGMGAEGNSVRLDTFGGGDVPVVANHLLPILGVGS